MAQTQGFRARALMNAFVREQASGARLGFRARLAGILVIAAALALRVGGEALLYYLGILGVLLASGWLFYQTLAELGARLGRLAGPARCALIATDMALLTVALVVPAPGAPDMWPPAMQLRVGNAGFLYLFLAFSALTYSPGLALWAGLSAGAAWMGGALYALSAPGGFTMGAADFAAMGDAAVVATLLDPNYVSLIKAGQDALLMAIAGGVLGVAVLRGRRVTMRQIESAQERARLARYFSPDMVEELTHGFQDMDEVERRRAAILFADIFGFTTIAERQTPEETLDFLREFHRRATGAVFASGGTLNKFIGDEVMASFGAIHDMDRSASAALAAALAITDAVADWSDERVAAGMSPVRVGVGVHFGEVVVGNIGDQRCLELAVLGDVVNVASRLQAASRDLDACVVASAAMLDAARAEGAPPPAGFTPVDDQRLRGRVGALPTFRLQGRGAAVRRPARIAAVGE